jgi:hypothetical protein
MLSRSRPIFLLIGLEWNIIKKDSSDSQSHLDCGGRHLRYWDGMKMDGVPDVISGMLIRLSSWYRFRFLVFHPQKNLDPQCFIVMTGVVPAPFPLSDDKVRNPIPQT